ncbi:tetratricopeptide repeat protein [Kitasatospora sp. NPDC057500]|uniref:tetratricopeptide repeat protein n=1 Tax=Kitasatospora sp. NPDC057500 TaxID=3346151 RepID=UPI003673EE50
MPPSSTARCPRPSAGRSSTVGAEARPAAKAGVPGADGQDAQSDAGRVPGLAGPVATGQSLTAAGLVGAALTHWQHLAADAERLLGDEHPDTLTALGSLAASYWQAGRTGEAIGIKERRPSRRGVPGGEAREATRRQPPDSRAPAPLGDPTSRVARSTQLRR